MKRRQRSIAERQERLNKICKVAEYVTPIVASAAAAAILNLMVLR